MSSRSSTDHVRELLRPDSEDLRTRVLRARDRTSAQNHLRAGLPEDLLLMDFVDFEEVHAGYAPVLCGAWRGSRLEGLVSLRPSILLDSRLQPEALAALLPYIERLSGGLVKSCWTPVSTLWDHLSAIGRRSLIDRRETLYLARPEIRQTVAAPPGVRVRPAEARDLEALVVAASASLREEGRPDPFPGDPIGFRAWVKSRLPRARVVDRDGAVVFVAYADVRRSEGWLIQGVYTMPENRRSGFAAIGMSAILDEAFSAGTDHVQLAVVDGNDAGLGLYNSLGFEATSELRTILFG